MGLTPVPDKGVMDSQFRNQYFGNCKLFFFFYSMNQKFHNPGFQQALGNFFNGVELFMHGVITELYYTSLGTPMVRYHNSKQHS